MHNALIRLLKVANALDQAGLHEYADQIDLLVLAAGQRTRAVDNFINELTRIFTIVANNPTVPSINTENLQVILNVINTVADKQNFLNPDIPPETVTNMEDEPRITVEGLAELSDAIAKLNVDFQTEKDPEKRRIIKIELDKDNKQFGDLWAKIDLWRNGKRKDDAEKYQRFEKLWNEYKQETGV